MGGGECKNDFTGCKEKTTFFASRRGVERVNSDLVWRSVFPFAFLNPVNIFPIRAQTQENFRPLKLNTCKILPVVPESEVKSCPKFCP